MSELSALLLTPLSGPLARFGTAAARGLQLWAEHAAELPAPWRGVRLELRDAHPDPVASLREGLAGRPQLVFGPYGSGPSLRAFAASPRLIWNHGGASSRIRWPEFARIANVLAPADTYFRGALEAIRDRDAGARSVSILHGDTGFGRDVAGGAAASAAALGFDVATKAFPRGEALRAASSLPEADVLLVAGRFEDELESARALLGRGWAAACFVGAGVEEVLAPLGAAREGLLGPAQWLASTSIAPDEGPDAEWFVRRYRRAAGGEPPYPAAQAFAAGLLAARCLRDVAAGSPAPASRGPIDACGEVASACDDAQLAAARRLDCRTLYGAFRLDPESGLQVGHRVLTVQWRDGRRRAIWPPELAECSLAYPRRRAR